MSLLPPPPISTDPIALQMLAMQQESPLLVALFDAEDRLRFANEAFRTCYDVPPELGLSWAELMQRNYEKGQGALIRAKDFSAWLASARSRRGKEPFRAFEADLCDGRWIWMTETVRSDGWMMCIASDITALKTNQRALRQARDQALRAAQTDVLTGISNRAHLFELLEQQISKLQSVRQPCGVALLDLDHFKRINDTYGHQAGDAVLKDFATSVQKILRREDGFGRVGGEEFMLILPGIDAAEMTLLMPRVLGVVRASRPLPEQPDFFYTSSAGVTLLVDGDDARSVYHRVDEALYAAKHGGRDRYAWAH